MRRCAAPSSGSGLTDMPKVAIVAALEREVSGLTRSLSRVEHQYDGRRFVFFEADEIVLVCGGIGVEAARRAAEAVIALYSPTLLQSVGFAGALDAGLGVGDLFMPAIVIDARDGSRIEIEGAPGLERGRQGRSSLVTFTSVAGAHQTASLAKAYGAQAVDMEAAGVAAAARAHGIRFAATKVISDELDFEMPQTARFIAANGRFKTANFAAFVALRPWLWRRTATLAANSRKAARVLSEHLKHYRQELNRSPSPVAASPATAEPQPAAAGGSHVGGRE
jgi:adenosylhomocysteine nucleosidase